jgi:CHASE2 domain-containing sensor protein
MLILLYLIVLKVLKGTYLSIDLIPVLYCHPSAIPFSIPSGGIWQKIKPWLPNTKKEIITISSALLFSLSLTIVNQFEDLWIFLFDTRLYIQAIYRDVTNQIPVKDEPEILLVEFDQSYKQKYIDTNIRPFPRNHITKLINKLTELDAKVIGINFLLETPQPQNDPALIEAIVKGYQKDTKFIFNTLMKEEIDTTDSLENTKRYSFAGHGNADQYLFVLPDNKYCQDRFSCPFSYVLALVYLFYNDLKLPNYEDNPSINEIYEYFEKEVNYIFESEKQQKQIKFLLDAQLSPLTLSTIKSKLYWFFPLIDYSIPDQTFYQTIKAKDIIENNIDNKLLNNLENKIIIISARYDEAGYLPGSSNNSIPSATTYWRNQKMTNFNDLPYTFTDGEIHSYMTAQLLDQRLLMSIPDSWLIILAFILGKGIFFYLVRQNRKQQNFNLKLLVGGNIIYGIMGLQLFIISPFLVPFVFPSAVFWLVLIRR